MLSGWAGAAHAGGDDDGPVISTGPGEVNIEGQQTTNGNGQDSGPGGVTGGAASQPQAYYQHRYTPNCSANTNGGIGDAGGALCGGAVYTCPGEGEIRYRDERRLVRINGTTGPWEPNGTVCLGPDDEKGVVDPVVTAQMVVDAARSLAPATTFTVQPQDKTFVHVPTNFVADTAGSTERVFLFGDAIDVRFEPTDYAWSFGDGQSGSGPGISGAAIGQDGAVEHAYTRAEDVDVQLTRVFTVSFTLPNGRQVSIPGEISTTSAPYGLAVGQIETIVTDVG